MKPAFTVKPALIILLFIALNLNSCVQPYSSKAFYNNNNEAGKAASNANESAQSLTTADVRAILNTPGLSERKLGELLQKMDRHWIVKGFDAKTGEVFYVNFYSRDNQEAFVWHSRENAAEYVTTNTNHYKSIVDNLKVSGYKVINSTTQAGETYSNGKYRISVSQTQLYSGSKGYKIIFNDKN